MASGGGIAVLEQFLGVFARSFGLAALANRTQWPALRAFHFCGTCILLLSLTFGLLTTLESFKYQRRKRAILAAFFFLAAASLCTKLVRVQ